MMIQILGVRIDKVTMKQAVERVLALSKENRSSAVFTPNSEIVYQASKEPEFQEVLNQSDLNTADGIGVVYASKILKNPIAQRVPGYDLACELLPHMNQQGAGLFLVGGKEGIAQAAGERIQKKYPNIRILGTLDGYFQSSQPVVEEINRQQPDYTFVCLGAPKQEKWIIEHQKYFSKGVFLGLGGSLDVFAGSVKRSPDIFIRLNLEWLHRLLKNPSRLGRAAALPKFAWAVIRSRKEQSHA